VKLEIVTPRDRGIIATDINDRGDVIGFEWVEEKEFPGVIRQAPFYARGEELTYLPLLTGYTATFPAAVSDDGVVVGRVSKPVRPGMPAHLRNQAFLWDVDSGISGLGAAEGDQASFATGVTRDGRRISGFSVGPDRIRACLWEREGDVWRMELLPHESRLGSNVVAISGGGDYVAAVDGEFPCLWSRDPAGGWTRRTLGESASLIPRAVNDSATVVGLRHDGEGRTHAVIWTREHGLESLPKPEGFDRSEATSLNNSGVVVGMVDGPAGAETGPRAFAYRDGRMTLIESADPPRLDAATAINDRGQVAGVVEEVDEEAKPDQPEPEEKPKG
jgi:uncharacterized membrane protein